MKKLSGQVALVTGAARGIGFAVAKRLLEDGARVALADIDRGAVAERAVELGEDALGIALDVTRPEQFADALSTVEGAFGQGVDILVNNAGIAGRSAPSWELTVEEWRECIDIDLSGTYYGCRAVLPGMIERGRGRIVNVASIAGKEGNPNASPYSAAKAGVIGLTKSIAKEVAERGICVNCITPAVIETELLQQVSRAHLDYMLSRIPMKRPGKVEEVAALVAFLASPECSFSTGAVFDVSGGRATY